MSPSSTSSSGLMAPIPIRIQFLSQSIFTTFNLGLTTLSVTGSRSLHYLVTSLLNFVDGQISATDPSAPPPHALGPLAPPHLRSPPTLTPSHVTGFSPGKLRDLSIVLTPWSESSSRTYSWPSPSLNGLGSSHAPLPPPSP